MSQFEALIQSIKKPLSFIIRTHFQKLEQVKGLDRVVLSLLDQAIACAPSEKQGQVLQRLREAFAGFDRLGPEAKRLSITEALRMLEGFEGAEERDGEAVSGALVTEKLSAVGTPIQFIKGVGPRLAELLKKKGIASVEDALYNIPRDYEDRRTIKPISKAKVGERETLRGKVLALGTVSYHRRRVFEMVVGDESGSIIAKWFNLSGAYLKRKFEQGQQVIISGKVEAFRYQKEMYHPDIEVIEDGEDEQREFARIVPKYSETEGLHQKTIRRIMKQVVEGYARALPDAIPREICRARNLVDLAVALERVHFPGQDDEFSALVAGKSAYHRRIVFDEFFFLELALALRRRGTLVEAGIAFRTEVPGLKKLEKVLPFQLTAAQKRVIEEIKKDMARPHPMHRLIQGDVGSGKTVVAFAAAAVAKGNGYQTAIMAPTELLAEQHYLTLHHFAEKLGVSLAFLSSSTRKSVRTDLYQKIEKGLIDLVIGTHAVIQEGVEFAKLGLGIIDEQHRFGVMQRASLKRKGSNPDVLVMTATPIPRTLAMTVYGDLDISVIDELPPGRTPVKTKVFHEKERQKVYEMIGREIEKGHQAYVVYPLIEESEKLDLMDATKMYTHLKAEVFPYCKVALLHGRMKSEEKEEVMRRFKAKEIQILVATTVIEVGIDVPEATLMVVEHAERFGLSQLHQLRGRVGRGAASSTCVLLAQYRKSDDARQRLRVMEETNDGFKIAEEDLSIRGPGEFCGVRQSGIADFRVANIIRDATILNEAREEAFDLVRKDPGLENPEYFLLREVLKHRWKTRLELASVG